MGIFDELKRRNVFRVTVAYLIVAWLAAQIADLVLDNIGAPDWVMPALFLMLALGFVASVIISWAYEITPEGIKREQDVVRDDSITHLTAKKLDYITIAAVVGVVVMFGLQQGDRGTDSAAALQSDGTPTEARSIETTAANNRSIAVLPFANRSNQDDDLFFTDGIHDDLLTQLAKINDLKVTSRTSVMQYRDTEMHIPDIAAELGVSTILEGGVQRAGQRIRINAQLIDVATDEHLWAETFDREMTIDNLFDIQSEITRQIVAAVRGELTEDEENALDHAPTENVEAYEAYSRARILLYHSGYGAAVAGSALPFAERAVALDPNFAIAQLLLANVHAQLVWTGFDSSPEMRSAALAAAEKAASLLPQDSPELLAVQGEFLYRFDHDYLGASELFRRAHRAMPGNATVAGQFAYALRRLGKWEEAIDVLLKVRESDPAAIAATADIADNLVFTRQWSRLEVFISQLDQRVVDRANIGMIRAGIPLWTRGDIDEARKLLGTLPPSDDERYTVAGFEFPMFARDYEGVVDAWNRPDILALASIAGFRGIRESYLAQAYQHLGDQERAAELLQQGIELFANREQQGTSVNKAFELCNFAELLAESGEFDRAIAAAEEAYEIVPPDVDHISGIYVATVLVKVLAMSGERDRALELLAKIIDRPAMVSRWELYLDPRWDFFRDDERFNNLIRPRNLEN